MGVQEWCVVKRMARARGSKGSVRLRHRAETRRELSEWMRHRTEKCCRGGGALIPPRMEQVVELRHDGLVAEVRRHMRRQREDGEPVAVEGNIGEIACGKAGE